MKLISTLILSFVALISFAHANDATLKTAESDANVTSELSKHPHLTIKIDSIEVNDLKYAINFEYEGKIKNETGLLYLNDSIALNVIYIKKNILGKTEYFDSYNFYRKSKDGNWNALSFYHLFSFTPGSNNAGWGSIGAPGYPNYFRFKMYLKFD